MKSTKLSGADLELSRFDALPKKHQPAAILTMSSPCKRLLLARMSASFMNGAKLDGDFLTYSTTEILLFLESLNFNVEKKSKFKTIFQSLKNQNLTNSLDSLATIETTFHNAILSVRNKSENYTRDIRAKSEADVITIDGIEQSATLDDFTHFDIYAVPNSDARYFYNAVFNEHHAIGQFSPAFTAYRMIKAYITNVHALIANKQAAKLLDQEYGVTTA
jgi:hypothetical protein